MYYTAIDVSCSDNGIHGNDGNHGNKAHLLSILCDYLLFIQALEKKILVPKSNGVLLVTDYKNTRSDQTMQHLVSVHTVHVHAPFIEWLSTIYGYMYFYVTLSFIVLPYCHLFFNSFRLSFPGLFQWRYVRIGFGTC